MKQLFVFAATVALWALIMMFIWPLPAFFVFIVANTVAIAALTEIEQPRTRIRR